MLAHAGVPDHAPAEPLSCCTRRRSLRNANDGLRASALLALAKLMCLDAGFCEANLQLLFTLLHTRCVAPSPSPS